MIELIAVKPQDESKLKLRFSDGASGVFDFARYVDAGTSMTEPLRDPKFFRSCFIEAGALAWPNGFDLSAESLYRRLDEAGQLTRDPKAA